MPTAKPVDTLYFYLTLLYLQAIYPLVTVLLCVSQKAFFLSSWPSFLNMCLGTLKVTYDPSSSRIEKFSIFQQTNNGAMSGSG